MGGAGWHDAEQHDPADLVIIMGGRVDQSSLCFSKQLLPLMASFALHLVTFAAVLALTLSVSISLWCLMVKGSWEPANSDWQPHQGEGSRGADGHPVTVYHQLRWIHLNVHAKNLLKSFFEAFWQIIHIQLCSCFCTLKCLVVIAVDVLYFSFNRKNIILLKPCIRIFLEKVRSTWKIFSSTEMHQMDTVLYH